MSNTSCLYKCIDTNSLFYKEKNSIGMPENRTSFKVIQFDLIEHPFLCVYINGIYHPIVQSIKDKYLNSIKSIKYILTMTELGAMRLIPVNINSNDTWSKSKRLLLSCNDNLTVSRNSENECYEFKISNTTEIIEPSPEQVEKFIQNTLVKLIIHEGNIDLFDELILTKAETLSKSSSLNEEDRPLTIIKETIGEKEVSQKDADDIFNIDLDNLDVIEG